MKPILFSLHACFTIPFQTLSIKPQFLKYIFILHFSLMAFNFIQSLEIFQMLPLHCQALPCFPWLTLGCLTHHCITQFFFTYPMLLFRMDAEKGNRTYQQVLQSTLLFYFVDQFPGILLPINVFCKIYSVRVAQPITTSFNLATSWK